jgi:hypothetical protein
MKRRWKWLTGKKTECISSKNVGRNWELKRLILQGIKYNCATLLAENSGRKKK